MTLQDWLNNGWLKKHALADRKYSLDPDPAIILSFEVISRKRAIVTYDSAGTITNSEVAEAINLARDLQSNLLAWLAAKYPKLMS